MIPKFRAWDKDSKVMREIRHLVWAEDNLIAHCPPRGHEFSEWFTVILNGWEYQLMQSTGMKDKNGVEIFEGDVVAFEDSDGGYEYQDIVINTGIVEYGELGFYFTNRVAVDMDDFYIKDGRCDDVEVIGNIYENPEVIGNIYENSELLSYGTE